MIKIYDVFTIGGICFSVIISLILFLRTNNTKFANRLLSITLFATAWNALIHLLLVTNWIEQAPYLYKVGSPLYYLIPPLGYLYLRSILHGESGFRKWDGLHFIPAILVLTDLLPYYFSESQTNLDLVYDVTKNNGFVYQAKNGFLPSGWSMAIRPIQIVSYLVFQWYSVLQAFKYKHNFIGFQTQPGLGNWLLIISTFYTLLSLGLVSMSVALLIDWNMFVNLQELNQFIFPLLGILLFLFNAYLFFKPEFLYGYYQPKLEISQSQSEIKEDAAVTKSILTEANPAQTLSLFNSVESDEVNSGEVLEEKNDSEKITLINTDQLTSIAECVGKFLRETKIFQKHGITINELALELDIPARQLSFVLNAHYNQRFTDFINAHRIDYIVDRLQGNDWKQLTLEGLAAEAGFSSRTTFFTAFKKFTKVSPTEFIKGLEAAA